MTLAATERRASWLCPWEQIASERPCSLEAAATTLLEERCREGTCLLHPKTWKSKNLLERNSLWRCLSAFWVTEPYWSACSLIAPYWWQSPSPSRAGGGAHEVPVGEGSTPRWLASRPGNAGAEPLSYDSMKHKKEYSGEDLGCCGKTKTKRLELVNFPLCGYMRVNGNLAVVTLEVNGEHCVPIPDQPQNQRNCLHLNLVNMI